MLKRYLKEYEYYLKVTKGLSVNTIYSYTTDLQEYTTFLEKNYNLRDPNEITKQHVRNFIARLKRKSRISFAQKSNQSTFFFQYLE